MREDAEAKTQGQPAVAPILKGFADTTEFALLAIDRHGNISFVNAATERMFGYAAAEMVGQTSTSSFRSGCAAPTAPASSVLAPASRPN